MRRAFGLLQVLMILLFIGGLVTVTMKYVSIGPKHYADSFTREQAELFLQSATEAAILQIQAYDRSGGNCYPGGTIISSDGRFEATVTINRYYLADGSTCANAPYEAIQTGESHGMVDMTMTVTSQMGKVGHPVQLSRRSLQRP
ncbi:MAG: hypothetical protein AB7S65_12925 [Sulfuricurvum sp.]